MGSLSIVDKHGLFAINPYIYTHAVQEVYPGDDDVDEGLAVAEFLNGKVLQGPDLSCQNLAQTLRKSLQTTFARKQHKLSKSINCLLL